jgi:hypothetical protein
VAIPIGGVALVSARASLARRLLLLLPGAALAAVSGTALMGPGARAAEVIRIEVEFFEGGNETPVNRATVLTSQRRVRVEQRSPGAVNSLPVFIYRGDQDRLYSIVEQARSYVVIERQMLERLGSGTRSARREVDLQLDGVPKDQQRLFGHWLGASQLDPNRPDDPLVVKRSDEMDTVAGYACRRVTLSRSSRVLAAGCVADWQTVGLTPEDVEVFRSLALLARDAMASRSPIPKELVPGQPLDLIVQLGGFPVFFERAGHVAGDNSIRVASVERIAADDSLFEVPTSFTARTGMTGLMGFSSLLSMPSRGTAQSTGPAAIDSTADPLEGTAPVSNPTSSPTSIAADAPPAIRDEPRPRPVSRARWTPKPYRSISLFEDP